MYQTFKPSLAVLIMSLPFLLFPSASHAQVPLTLPETVHLALAANDPGVKALEMKAQAFEDKAIADSQLPDPVLSTQIANFPLASLDYNREAMTQLKFGISQKLPKGQTLILTRNKRQTEARSYRAQKALIERQIVLQARQTWLELYYWREAKRLTLESRKQVSELGGVAKSVFASGRSSLQDVLRVELETTALDAKLLDIERKRDMARATLERLLGPVNGARPLATKPPLLPVLPDQSEIRGRLAAHPSIRVLQARIKARSYDVDLAEQQYKPGFSFNAQYGLRDSRSDFGSLGVSVSMPLFSKTSKDRALSAAKRMRAAQKLERDVQALELERQLRGQWASYKRLDERIQLYERDVLPRARETSEAAMSAYSNQLADFSELVRAELAVLNTELTLARLRTDRLKAHAMLLYLSGE